MALDRVVRRIFAGFNKTPGAIKPDEMRGGNGTAGTEWDVLAIWRAKCTGPVTGPAFDCGHFLQEERPDELLAELRQFLN